MNLNIAHYPNLTFTGNILFFPLRLKIDLNESFKEKLGNSQATNALALKILKQIKLKSDVVSFLTKPVVFIPLSVVVTIAGIVIPPTGIILTAISIILCLVGGTMLSISIRSSYDNYLSLVSQAYSDQSQRAATYIQQIESSNQQLTFTYA